MSQESGIEALVRFARLASVAKTRSAILPLLADALEAQVRADAVAIVEIQENGETQLVPSPHLPAEMEALSIDADAIEEAPERLLATVRERFEHVESRPLVSGGGLFGLVVMFFADAPRKELLPLAEGLVDLAASSLESVAKLQQLVRSNAELRASQDTLARTEKLRALGQMAAGISHDLKNMLNPLSLHLQFIDRAIDRGDAADMKDSVSEMKQVLARGVQTVERLREYSRQSPESRAEAINLDTLVHEASEIARPRMSARGGRLNRMKEELAAPPLVMGRSGDIVSALVNLIVNAIDAMPRGGTITLRTGQTGGCSWVSVQDDGPGMPPDVQRRAFEPFFTTKGEEGTGLGLAMVYACMQRHGGTVSLETAPGRGTTFTLSFPAIGA